jgi:hypothetical protein
VCLLSLTFPDLVILAPPLLVFPRAKHKQRGPWKKKGQPLDGMDTGRTASGFVPENPGFTKDSCVRTEDS